MRRIVHQRPHAPLANGRGAAYDRRETNTLEVAMTVLKVPFPLWIREHGDGVSMAVMQLVDDAFDVVHHRGVTATQIPNGRFPTLEAACARADAYMKEQGHECTAACGQWHRKV
jgi:hypothetical protein